jgi:hypothetical protein
VPRSRAKPKAPAVWQISRVAKKAIYLGQVEAADAEAAIKKFDIDPAHQDRLAVNFQEVVHSVPTVNAEVAKQRDSRRTEWTVTRMLP